MRFRLLPTIAIVAGALAIGPAASQTLAAPGFHHLHLNSTNPDAAIAFYLKQFPSTSKTSWGGVPALASPNNVLVLFNRVTTAPTADPEAAAFWHFGWHVTDVRKNLATYQDRPEVTLAPLYTGDTNNSVFVSSDTWPGTGGILGLTAAQIADAKARGVQPLRGAGFAYLRGPDNALIEYQGNDPFCAQAWYRAHLNAALPPNAQPRSEADCKVARGPDKSWPALNREGMYRTPTAGVIFGDVSMNWYMRQREVPLMPTRGRLMDHIALSVANLDAWVAKLRSENVRFLEQEHRLGDTRAVMIEGPSREAIELVEVK
jgi:catechol 2,3-dioxygenase-like lactoylglutathione lyase family enzyme